MWEPRHEIRVIVRDVIMIEVELYEEIRAIIC